VIEILHEALAETAEAQCLASHDELENKLGDPKVDPEQALRRTNAKFRKPFAYVEQELAERGKKLEDSNIAEMEALWQEAKQ
jgi:uncharacterized protein YabN with tetrapyrrole methylase and pyrophosphatase domain